MKYNKWIGLSAVAVLIIAAYQPWIFVVSKNITVTGMHTPGTNFGRPALLNIFTSLLAAVCYVIPSIAAKRSNLFITAFNLAWSIRNFIIVSTCRAGECPHKKAGLYILIISSIVMVLVAMFPDVKLKQSSEPELDRN